MQHLSETAGALTLSYPWWIGMLMLVAGAALAVYVVKGKAAANKRFGIGAAALVCFVGAGHFLGYKAVIGAEEARVYSPLREDSRIAWSDVARARIEERSSGRGGRSTYVVLYGSGIEVPILVSSLSYEERARVLDALRARLPGGHLD